MRQFFYILILLPLLWGCTTEKNAHPKDQKVVRGEKSVPPPCGDLLNRYDRPHPKIVYQSCKKVINAPQRLLEATYHVTTEDIELIEQYLIDQYNAKPLKFACCGWENREGWIRSSKLPKLFHLSISLVSESFTDQDGKEIIPGTKKEAKRFIATVTLWQNI